MAEAQTISVRLRAANKRICPVEVLQAAYEAVSHIPCLIDSLLCVFSGPAYPRDLLTHNSIIRRPGIGQQRFGLAGGGLSAKGGWDFSPLACSLSGDELGINYQHVTN